MLLGVAMTGHGATINCRIQGMTHQMVVGQQGQGIGTVLALLCPLVNNGGGHDKPKRKGMAMQPWKAGLRMRLAVQTMHPQPMVYSQNTSTIMGSLTMSAPW